jgi:hypothetical protein
MTNDRPQCQWFAMCENSADGIRSHPVLGAVPICERCAATVGEPLTDEERAELG